MFRVSLAIVTFWTLAIISLLTYSAFTTTNEVNRWVYIVMLFVITNIIAFVFSE